MEPQISPISFISLHSFLGACHLGSPFRIVHVLFFSVSILQLQTVSDGAINHDFRGTAGREKTKRIPRL